MKFTSNVPSIKSFQFIFKMAAVYLKTVRAVTYKTICPFKLLTLNGIKSMTHPKFVFWHYFDASVSNKR